MLSLIPIAHSLPDSLLLAFFVVSRPVFLLLLCVHPSFIPSPLYPLVYSSCLYLILLSFFFGFFFSCDVFPMSCFVFFLFVCCFLSTLEDLSCVVVHICCPFHNMLSCCCFLCVLECVAGLCVVIVVGGRSGQPSVCRSQPHARPEGAEGAGNARSFRIHRRTIPMHVVVVKECSCAF